MSPGTSSAAGIWCSSPSRRTWAVGTACRCRAVSACSAFHSVRKPTAAFRTMTTRMATASMFSPSANATTVAARSRATMRLLNWPTRIARTERPFASARAFGPNCLRLRAASALVRPLVGSAWRARATSSADSVCHGRSCSPAMPGWPPGESASFPFVTLLPFTGFTGSVLVVVHGLIQVPDHGIELARRPQRNQSIGSFAVSR